MNSTTKKNTPFEAVDPGQRIASVERVQNGTLPFLIDLNQMFRDPTLLGVSIYFDRITDLVECFE